MTPPVFAHGHLRLYLLSLLEDQPRHGYELIQALSERFDGTYSPSAGTITSTDLPLIFFCPSWGFAPASCLGNISSGPALSTRKSR